MVLLSGPGTLSSFLFLSCGWYKIHFSAFLSTGAEFSWRWGTGFNGTDLWDGTKDSFAGLSLTFLLPCICSALSVFFEMSCKWICPTGICQISTFLWSLGSGSPAGTVRAYVTQSFLCYYCHLRDNCRVPAWESGASLELQHFRLASLGFVQWVRGKLEGRWFSSLRFCERIQWNG